MDNYSSYANNNNSALATASMVFGILSLVFLLIAGLPISIFLGTMAIILGHLSRGDKKLYGHAKAGFIMGIISTIASFAAIIALICLFCFNPYFKNEVVAPIVDEFVEEFNNEFQKNYHHYHGSDNDDYYYDDYYDDDYDDDYFNGFFYNNHNNSYSPSKPVEPNYIMPDRT